MGLFDGICKAIGNIGKGIGDAFKKIGDGVGNVVKGAGKVLTGDIWDGLKDMGTGVVDATVGTVVDIPFAALKGSAEVSLEAVKTVVQNPFTVAGVAVGSTLLPGLGIGGAILGAIGGGTLGQSIDKAIFPEAQKETNTADQNPIYPPQNSNSIDIRQLLPLLAKLKQLMDSQMQSPFDQPYPQQRTYPQQTWNEPYQQSYMPQPTNLTVNNYYYSNQASSPFAALQNKPQYIRKPMAYNRPVINIGNVNNLLVA